MPALILQLTRIGFLILLCLFVLAAMRVVRSDLRYAAEPRGDGGPAGPGPRSRPTAGPGRPAAPVDPGGHRRFAGRYPAPARPGTDPDRAGRGFGTGAVKVTPAHDPNDFEIGQRPRPAHRSTSWTSAAVITATRARSRAWTASRRVPPSSQALRAEGRIVAEKRPYVHAVGHCARCDTVVEPRLSLQWCVKVEPLAQGRRRRGPRRPGRDPPAEPGAALLRLGRQHARLVHLAPAVVGPPHPGLVRPERRDASASVPTTSRRRRGLDAGPRRARHLVLLGAVAVLDAGLARRHPRPARSSIRPTSWSPATTSSSSGSPG